MSQDRPLDALSCKGVLINASVRYWRTRKKLSPADLGLPDDKVNRRLISLGHKRLLPKERLAGLALAESRAHALIETSCDQFIRDCTAELREQTALLAGNPYHHGNPVVMALRSVG